MFCQVVLPKDGPGDRARETEVVHLEEEVWSPGDRPRREVQ